MMHNDTEVITRNGLNQYLLLSIEWWLTQSIAAMVINDGMINSDVYLETNANPVVNPHKTQLESLLFLCAIQKDQQETKKKNVQPRSSVARPACAIRLGQKAHKVVLINAGQVP